MRRLMKQKCSATQAVRYPQGVIRMPILEWYAIENRLRIMQYQTDVSIPSVLLAERESINTGKLPDVFQQIEWRPMPCQVISPRRVWERVFGHQYELQSPDLVIRQDAGSSHC
jgi:hypothetical protein